VSTAYVSHALLLAKPPKIHCIVTSIRQECARDADAFTRILRNSGSFGSLRPYFGGGYSEMTCHHHTRAHLRHCLQYSRISAFYRRSVHPLALASSFYFKNMSVAMWLVSEI
jgi:hypothetical protein